MKKIAYKLLIIGITIFFIGIAILLLGAIGPKMGLEGFIFNSIATAGVVVAAIGCGIIVIIIACEVARDFFRGKQKILPIVKELFQFLLSLIVYGGGTFFLLALLISFDKDIPLLGRCILICIGMASLTGMILFRKYRKKHIKKFDHIGGLLVIIFFMCMVVFFMWGGMIQTSKIMKDVMEGYPIEETKLDDVRMTRQHNRKSFTSYYLKGKDEDGEDKSFQINYETYIDWKERYEYDDDLTACVYYYMNTRVVYKID